VVFDLSEEELFYELVQIFKRFKKSAVKERADLFALLMGLNHLREWIAPGYRPRRDQACNPAQLFYDKIYGLPEWKTINELCNKTKHLKQVRANETVGYELPFNQWPNVSSVVNFSKGPPTGFSVKRPRHRRNNGSSHSFLSE
jgi:hypothetical protein